MPTIPVGGTTALSPVQKDETGMSVAIDDVTSLVWVIGDPQVAEFVGEVSPSGLRTLRGLREGTTTVSATNPATSLTNSEVLTVKGIAKTLEFYWGGGVEI